MPLVVTLSSRRVLTHSAEDAAVSQDGYQQVSKTSHWRIFWTDGYERRDAQVSEDGECYTTTPTTMCWPEFDAPYWHSNTNTSGVWNQRTRKGYATSPRKCQTFSSGNHDHFQRHTCSTAGGCTGATGTGAGTASFSGEASASLLPDGELSCQSDWYWDGCQRVPASPVTDLLVFCELR